MIEAISMSKYYKLRGKKYTVFNDLSLTINPGERIALMGKNGAGKSTLLRILCGIEKPSSGILTISSQLSWPVGLSSGFISSLTGKENVKFICRLFRTNPDETKEKMAFVRDFSEIGHYFDLPVQSYSSGMRSRLSFGLSMAFDFDFYVIDEALAVGDKAFKKKCLRIFNHKIEKKGIIMASHSINLIKEFCTQGIFLHENSITQTDNTEDLIRLYKKLA